MHDTASNEALAANFRSSQLIVQAMHRFPHNSLLICSAAWVLCHCTTEDSLKGLVDADALALGLEPIVESNDLRATSDMDSGGGGGGGGG